MSQIIPVVILALAIALAVVASKSSGRLALSVTAAGLAAGACALVAAILLPSSGGETAAPG